MEGSGDGAWSRAFMASSGVSVHGDSTVRHASAEEREAATDGTSSVRLRELSVAKEQAVREAVARRPDCPFGVLASLAHDRRDDVRVAVAANPAVSRAILEHLIHDRSSSVLCAIARNASTPRDILETLAVHRKPEVRRVAGKLLDEPPLPTHAVGAGAQQLPPELRERGTVTALPVPTPHAPPSPPPAPAPSRDRVLAPRPSVPAPRLDTPAPLAGWLPIQ